MQILICCGNGVGSSFMIEMNVKKILDELGVSDIEVNHADLTSAKGSNADIFLATKDLGHQLESLNGEIILLSSMINVNELKTKLEDKLKEMKVIS